MSSQEEISDSPNGDIFHQKKKPKVLRVLTVMAYVLSVSMAAILLSIYYVFMWKGQPHLGARRSEQLPNFLIQSNNTHGNPDMLPRVIGNMAESNLEPINVTASLEANATTALQYDTLGNSEANETDGKFASRDDDNNTSDLPHIGKLHLEEGGFYRFGVHAKKQLLFQQTTQRISLP